MCKLLFAFHALLANEVFLSDPALPFINRKRQEMIKKERKVTPERAIEILKKHGTNVTLDEAKLILDFAYNFSILAVNQVVINKKSK